MRVRFDLAYEGTEFAGWARQPDQRTVQGVLEDALGQVLRLPVHPSLTVAGRTDAGVHARGQVAHADLESIPSLRWLNAVLPDDVRVQDVSVAPPGFDARFAALSRRYSYRVTDAPVDPLRRRDTLAWGHSLDLAAMNAAAQLLTGEHDFAAYCKRRAGATTIRRLLALTWNRAADGVLEARVEADAFCHSMVRALVGALLTVGEGRRPVQWPGEVLAAGIRDSAVPVVPPHGLCLEEVRYPPDPDLAARAAATRQVRVLEGDLAADSPESIR
ncbi:MAG TPA: tRNA pseudouridine(38-40) synthase TruA [Frankiaceae bacterium]|jgi:tRNA pseudouridine38-40 synthase|nr:tRNA pseudouridine(38-40) synthase TruA [Frankiaceae bacterium]